VDKRNTPIKAIQELMGHSDIRVTMKDMHLTPEFNHGAVELLAASEPAAVRFAL